MDHELVILNSQTHTQKIWGEKALFGRFIFGYDTVQCIQQAVFFGSDQIPIRVSSRCTVMRYRPIPGNVEGCGGGS